MKSIIFTVSLLLVGASSDVIRPCRDPNEVYYECRPCARINCGDIPPDFCIAECRNPGCYCRQGYLRQNGTCVPESCCDNCAGPNEIYHECKPCAAINCGDKPPQFCLDVCLLPGCYCAPGYLRKNGICVPESYCGNCTGPNEEYLRCRPCRPINCGDKTPIICPKICEKPGCYCKKGYVRKNGECIPEQYCNKCTGPHERYYGCQPCVPINCTDLLSQPTICPAICRNPGCYCQRGYLRKNGKCVPQNCCYADVY